MKRLLIIFLFLPIILPAQKQGQAALDSMLRQLPAAKEDTSKVKLLNFLAFACSYNNPDDGIRYGQQALALAAKLDWKPGIGGADNCIGVNYFTMSDYAQALAYYAKAVNVYEALRDEKMIARVLDNTAVVYADQGEYAKAIDCLHKALKISEATGDKLSYKNNLTILANIHFDQSNYAQALDYYFKALKVAEEMGDKHGIFLAQEGISTVYAVQKDYTKALEYNIKDLKIAEEIGNKQDIAAVNTNIGGVYAAQNNYTKALEYFLAALKMEEEVGQKKDVAMVSINIGNAYAFIKNFRLAIAYDESSLEVATEIKDKYVAVQSLLAISDAYLGIVKDPAALQTVNVSIEGAPAPVQVPMPKIPVGRTALIFAATSQLQQGLAIAKQMHTPDLIQSCYEHLADAGKLSGNYKQALEYADSASAIKDSIFSTTNKSKIANLETKRDLDLKQKQIELDELELVKKRNERFFYIAAIALLIALGGLLINQQKLRQRKAEAEKKNAEALQYFAEKDKDRATYLLNERVKELSTIYLVNHILSDENKPISTIFNEIVNLLPPGWQYPEVCAARIVFDGNEYATPNYVPSPFKQDASIKTQDGRTGLIEVIYTREMPAEAEGPFLKEERDLINALVDIIEVYFNKKSHQDALAKSEANFRSSFEHAAIGMALVSPDGHFVKVNKELCNMLGYTEEELLSLTFAAITHPEHVDADVENIRQILDGSKDYYRTEKRYLHKNGSVIWVNLNSAIIRDSDSQPLYFVSQIENITERRESEQKFQGLVEKSVVGVYILQNGKFVYVNPRVCEESGYTAEELTSLPLDKFVHKDDVVIVHRNIRARMKSEVDEVRYDIRAVRKDGGIIWLEMFGTIMEYHGAPAIIGTIVNITEQKRSQELIKESQAELSAFFDNVEGAASLLDANKRYLIYNKAFIQEHKRLTGKHPMPGMEVYDLFPPEVKAERHALLDEVLKGNKQVIEVDHIRDGRHVFYRTAYNPVISDGKVIGISTYSIDLSEIKNAEREILRLNRLYQFISQINESMLKLENSEQIYAAACHIAVEVGKFQMAWIGTYDKKVDKITPVAWAGVEGGYFDAIDVAGMKVSQSEMLSARAIRTQTHIYYNDIANDPDIPMHVKTEMLKRNYLSGLSLPIFVNSEVVASLVLVMSEPFFFNDEEVRLLREVTDNITYALDKIRIRELHDKSEANLRSIFDTTHVSYLLLDATLNVLAYNQYLMSWYNVLTGITMRVGDNFIDQTTPEKREGIKKIFGSVVANSIPMEYDTTYANETQTMHITVTVTPVVTNGKTIGICVTAHDITNRKNIEIERQKMITDLQQRNRDLEQFSYIISHNVRGPLATMLGLNNLLKEETVDESLAFVVDGIGNSAERLDGVLRDLNEILHIRNDFSEAKEEVDLYEETERVKKNIGPLIDKSKAVIDFDFAVVDKIVTTRSYLYSICFNLITNAIKFAKPGTPPHVKIWSEKRGEQVCICFRDNGMGLDTQRYADRIFGLYQRFHPHIEGKGLGLYMAKTQVEAMNGKIEIESTPGNGTTFHVTLPA